jgi:hypothetical protein
MPTFFLKYKILDAHRSECTTRFGSMTADDDRKDMGASVSLKGRWSTVGESSGFCICTAETVDALNAWLLNWSSMATIEAVPVVDDNKAREIILGKSPDRTVTWNAVPKPNENLYLIEYTFFPEKRGDGYNAFAALSAEDDGDDVGKNTCLGRWHNLGDGTGVVVCSSPSEVDLYNWTYKWMELCTCKVYPVVTDVALRANIKSKPDFAAKLAALKPKRSGWIY